MTAITKVLILKGTEETREQLEAVLRDIRVREIITNNTNTTISHTIGEPVSFYVRASLSAQDWIDLKAQDWFKTIDDGGMLYCLELDRTDPIAVAWRKAESAVPLLINAQGELLNTMERFDYWHSLIPHTGE